jgi:hypothetical protein
MPDTVGGFNDLVQLSQDTLYVLGEELIVGNSAASTVTIGFSNTGGILALAAAQTANETIWLPLTSGTLLVDINVSAGTTSNNLSNVVFSNSYNVSFGLNGSTITANAPILVSAAGFQVNATQISFSNNNSVTFGLTSNAVSGAVISASVAQPGVVLSAGAAAAFATEFVFSNSNGISFGLNAGSVITASYTPANLVAAGTQTGAAGSTILFSNSNGFSFGMSNSSVVTAAYGGFSSWSMGPIHTTYSSSSAFLSLQPIVVPYEITVRNVVWIANATASATNATGGINVSAGLYTINGGTTGSLSIASSSSTALTFTSGAALSSYTGVGYRQMAVSWALTPGPYVFAFAAAPINAASFTFNGVHDPSAINIASGLGAAMSNMILPGISASSVGSIPNSIGITNTSGYLRTGSQVNNQPWVLFQGT